MVYHVKDADDFKNKLEEAGDRLVVVDFFASWCGPCKFITPKVQELSEANTDVVFLKVDVDECEEIASEYGISSMPTFVFIKNKEKVDSFSGANEARLNELMLKYKGA